MKIETKEIYKCEFCNKMYQVKRFAIIHEAGCFKNPENKRACLDCIHLTKKKIEIMQGYHYDGSESNRNVELFYCSAMNKFIYPPQSEAKKNYFDLGDEINEPMPKECDKYKYIYSDEPTFLIP